MSRARVPSRPDWHAVGRSLRAEHGAAMAPAAFAALVYGYAERRDEAARLAKGPT